jgi:hypothetical protein
MIRRSRKMRVLTLISLFAILLMASGTSGEEVGAEKKLTPGVKAPARSDIKCFNFCNYNCKRERLQDEYNCQEKLKWVSSGKEPFKDVWGYTPESVFEYNKCIGEAFSDYVSCDESCDSKCAGTSSCYRRCMSSRGDAALCANVCKEPPAR